MRKAFKLIVLMAVTGLLVVLMVLTACTQEPALASVKIDNQSGVNVISVYITPISAPTWGSDLLAGDIIPNGQSHLFTGFSPDTYDIQVWVDGPLHIEQWGIGLSAGDTHTWVLPHV